MATKTDRIYLRLSPDLKTQLQQLADEQHRTLSNLVEHLIVQAVEKDKKE